jgi:hypothetical protein
MKPVGLVHKFKDDFLSKIQYFTVCMLGVMHKVLSTSESEISADTAALFEFYLEL